MIDVEYINELRAIEDLKESKAALVEYAKTFNITVKKNQSFDKMVTDIEAQLNELASEPLPDDNEGLSISDLIQAADEKDGTAHFVGEAPEAAQLLIDTPVVNQVEVIENPTDPLVVDVVIKPQTEVQEIKLEISIEDPKLFELPKNFSPTLLMMGTGQHSYVTLPFWIYDWIAANPNWKTHPHGIPHAYAYDSLYSLIYFIKRDGYVRIRETKNSSFVILE